MSTTVPPVQPPSGSVAPPPPPGPTIVRLPWWVNVTLVLTLLGSCSAATNADDAAIAARSTANQATSTTQGASSDSEVAALCRLLGALAVKQGVNLNVAFGETDPTTNCHTMAQQAATPTP